MTVQENKYPLTIRVDYFKEGSDTRDNFNIRYSIEEVVCSFDEECSFYESLNHEANITIYKFT